MLSSEENEICQSLSDRSFDRRAGHKNGAKWNCESLHIQHCEIQIAEYQSVFKQQQQQQ